MKNKKQVGKALGRVPSGLFVVTTKFQDKEELSSHIDKLHIDTGLLESKSRKF